MRYYINTRSYNLIHKSVLSRYTIPYMVFIVAWVVGIGIELSVCIREERSVPESDSWSLKNESTHT